MEFNLRDLPVYVLMALFLGFFGWVIAYSWIQTWKERAGQDKGGSERNQDASKK